MIRIDSRIGSGELEKLFHPFGINVVKTKLEFGDFDFIGRGPKGSCAVVVERKRIEDLVQSMQSHRLSGHQLPGMAAHYDYCYLIVEGIWQPGAEGNLEVLAGRGWQSRGVHYRSIDNYLSTLELHAGVIYRRTGSAKETVFTIVDLYRWWTEKQWEHHKSHSALYTGRRLTLVPHEVSLAEEWASRLPGVDDKARAVAEHFGSAGELAAAPVSEWTGIEWRDKNRKLHKLGAKSAERIHKAIHARRQHN